MHTVSGDSDLPRNPKVFIPTTAVGVFLILPLPTTRSPYPSIYDFLHYFKIAMG